MNGQDHELQVLIEHPVENETEPVDLPISLTDFLFNGDELGLHAALTQAVEEDFTRKRPHPTVGNRNILTIACADSSVQENMFRILFDYTRTHLNHLDFTERGWYYWKPIHFAAYHTDLGKLRIIVDAYRETDRLNALSIVSENALHVLLAYGRRVESFNVQMSNSWESRICHVVTEENTEVVECAELLINAGIDVNHINIWNETPLLIAIRYRLLRVIRLLLTRHDLDLDRCKDSSSGKSARDILREDEICLDMLTPNTTTISHGKTLFNFLKNRDEELFLRYNNENIMQYVNETDGNIEFGATMLQHCLIKGYLDYERERSTVPEPNESNIFKTSMLKFFCRRGFGRCIVHLLDNGAVITRWIFQMSVKLTYYPFLAILLEHRTNQITEQHILEILGHLEGNFLSPDNSNAMHVLCLLINKLEVFHQLDDNPLINTERTNALNRILDFYLTNNGSNDRFKDNICQLLRVGASLIGVVDEEDPEFLRLNAISYNTLRAHLDDCICPTFEGCYDSLVRDHTDEYSETEALYYLSHDSEKNDLLNHPALVYLIHQEWLKNYKVFNVNLGFYFLFMLILFWYMVSLQTDMVDTLLLYAFVILLVTLTVKEVVQFLLNGLRYFSTISNYLEMTAIVCCFINVFSKNEAIMIVAILLSTLIFISMLGQLPQFTKYMVIFNSTKYFLEYASFYFIQFISFALCFFILIPPEQKEENSTFGDILIKLFETLFFFIGQYEGDITSQPNFPIFGRIIVALFVFCMTIILNNLLVGLIVTDMDSIQKSAMQQRQMKMIRYISRIEACRKKIERFRCFRVLRRFFSDTEVFLRGNRKLISFTGYREAFANYERAYLNEFIAKLAQPKNVRNTLYECIINEIYRDHRSGKTLFEVSRLEDQARSRL